MIKKLVLVGFGAALVVASTGCKDKEADRQDARDLCRGYPTTQTPWSDIYAAQYGAAGREADLTRDGFINIFEWLAFCKKVEAEIGINPPVGGGGGGGLGGTTDGLSISQY